MGNEPRRTPAALADRLRRRVAGSRTRATSPAEPPAAHQGVPHDDSFEAGPERAEPTGLPRVFEHVRKPYIGFDTEIDRFESTSVTASRLLTFCSTKR